MQELFNRLGEEEASFTGFIYIDFDKKEAFLSAYPQLKSCCQGPIPRYALFLGQDIENLKPYHQKIVSIEGSLKSSPQGMVTLNPIRYLFKEEKNQENIAREGFILSIFLLILLVFFIKKTQSP